jgi:hypothetical protein
VKRIDILRILDTYSNDDEATKKLITDAIFDLANDIFSFAELEEEYEPYFGWCNVEGCENEGANGGGCWRETGYWTVCSKHSKEFIEGKPQPPMKQWAIDKEKRRGADGLLLEI